MELARRIGGLRAARLAIMLGAATPFLLDELVFAWPKLLAAAFVLLAGLEIVERRPLRSGLLGGIGYLMHPSALLGLAGVGLLALWPLRRANWRRPDIRAAALLAAGVAVSVIAWRLFSGPHFNQNSFLEYFSEAGSNAHPSAGAWIDYRLGSLGNTLVPLMLPLFYASNHSINVFGGQSPPVIHFFFQYWAGVPFGLAFIFFPLLLISLWRAAQRWPWPFLAVVVAPLALFTVDWGSSVAGMLREGMQWWALTLLAVVALQQAAAGFPWLRSKPIRAILSLRALEALAALVGMTLGTNGFQLIGGQYRLNHVAAVALMLTCSLGMASAIGEPPPTASKCPEPERRRPEAGEENCCGDSRQRREGAVRRGFQGRHVDDQHQRCVEQQVPACEAREDCAQANRAAADPDHPPLSSARREEGNCHSRQTGQQQMDDEQS